MANEMRDRLVELLQASPYIDVLYGSQEEWESAAECLITNGVVVPPCKVGDVIYSTFNGEIKELKVISYSVLKSIAGNYQNIHTVNSRGAVVSYELHDFGKTVFLTKAEAEQKLKEMRGGND